MNRIATVAPDESNGQVWRCELSLLLATEEMGRALISEIIQRLSAAIVKG